MASNDKDEYTIFKYIIIGEMGVGKSALLAQFTEQKFNETTPTFGVEIGSRDIEINNKRIKIQIWDTAGQERFRSITRSYYKGTACALLVYDITRRETFLHLANWLTDARNLTNPHTQIIMVGNKLDLADQRAVSFEEATKFAQENNLVYLETSAKTGDNVEKAFLDTARGINERIDNGLIDPEDRESGVSITRPTIETPPTEKKQCCGL